MTQLVRQTVRSVRKTITSIPMVSDIARLAYFGFRTACAPVISRSISYKAPDFELFDGWRYYFFRRRAIQGGSFSQHAQDAYIAELTDQKRNGYFVDIGCNDPTRFNNTVFLERNFDWKGISIDAQSQFADRYRKERSTPFINACVGDVRKTVNFSRVSGPQHAGLSGVSDYLDERKLVGRTQDVTPMEQIPLMDILRPYDIRDIDCLFLDVEGYEMQVLDGIDFDALNISYFVIENDSGLAGSNEIRGYLSDRGYELRARILGEDVFGRSNDHQL